MFKVTKAAAAEIKRSIQGHEFDDLPLRIAAQRRADGAIEYQMGFDEAGPGDMMVSSSGVDVVIAQDHKTLLHGAQLDFVQLDGADQSAPEFIFLNPNDPSFVAPDTAVVTNTGEQPDERPGHDLPVS